MGSGGRDRARRRFRADTRREGGFRQARRQDSPYHNPALGFLGFAEVRRRDRLMAALAESVTQPAAFTVRSKDLRQRVIEEMRREPRQSWDAALADLISAGCT